MLAKLSALSLVVLSYVNGQEQTFLSKQNNLEVYQVQTTQTVEEDPAKVGDIQFKCQYIAGPNFFDLQPLDNKVTHIPYNITDANGNVMSV